jgi:isopenicillin N synthase-like dioxygenase
MVLLPVVDVRRSWTRVVGRGTEAVGANRRRVPTCGFPSSRARIDPACATTRAALAEFFALPEEQKAAIAMSRAGSAWRGWFPVGGELTSGVPDRKEGVYFGAELPASYPRVAAGTPLHGANQFPETPAGLGPVVLRWIDEVAALGAALLRGLALGLGLDEDYSPARSPPTRRSCSARSTTRPG